MARNQSEKVQELQRWVLHPNFGWLPLWLSRHEKGWVTYCWANGTLRAQEVQPHYSDALRRFEEWPSPFFFNVTNFKPDIIPYEDGMGPLNANNYLGQPIPNHDPPESI